MAIIEETDFNAGIVQPYVTMPYLSINKIGVTTDSGTDLYTTHDYYSSVPVTRVLGHTNPEIAFNGSDDTILGSFMLGQYHNNPMTSIHPKTAEYDLLTDIISGVYKYMCSEQPELAYLCMQAYSLISRMSSDNVPYIGSTATTHEVTPYAI